MTLRNERNCNQSFPWERIWFGTWTSGRNPFPFQMENISNFLESAKVYGVPDITLFQVGNPSDIHVCPARIAMDTQETVYSSFLHIHPAQNNLTKWFYAQYWMQNSRKRKERQWKRISPMINSLQTVNLFENKDFYKVIECLRALAGVVSYLIINEFRKSIYPFIPNHICPLPLVHFLIRFSFSLLSHSHFYRFPPFHLEGDCCESLCTGSYWSI